MCSPLAFELRYIDVELKELEVATTEPFDSLKRIFHRAQEHDGTAERAARFLLALYNGTRFPFDPTSLRQLPSNLHKDCILVLTDRSLTAEVHCLLGISGDVLERMAQRFRVIDIQRLAADVAVQAAPARQY